MNYTHLQTACSQMLVSKKALSNPFINCTNVPADKNKANPILPAYCQAQPKPQLQLKLWAELVIISVNPATHPPNHPPTPPDKYEGD